MLSTIGCDAALVWIASAGLIVGSVPPTVEPTPAPRAAETSTSGSEVLRAAPHAAAFAEAERLYVEGRLFEAIAAYHRLFIRTGEPVCLANLGRLYQERGEFAQAAEYYRRFLLHPRATEVLKQQVQRRLSAIAPDELVVLRSQEPPAPPPVVPEGPAPPTTPRTHAVPSGRAARIGGGVSLAVAVPMLVAGGVVAAQTKQLRERLQTADFESAEQRGATREEAIRKRDAAVGLLVVGVAALVAGSVLLAVGGRTADRARQERRIALQPSGLVVRF